METLVKKTIQEKKLQLPFSAVTGLIETLKPREWLILREWLDEKLAQREDAMMFANPRIMREIHQAISEYHAGKYVTTKKLRNPQRKKSRQNGRLSSDLYNR
ncbi:MAG: hypothetical protein ACREOI_21940 [bacterium]